VTGFSNGGPGAFNTPTGVAAAADVSTQAIPRETHSSRAIGYTPVNPNARYVVAGPGASATVSRNSFNTPGFGVLNMSVSKSFHFTEGKYLQAKVDVFNILNTQTMR